MSPKASKFVEKAVTALGATIAQRVVTVLALALVGFVVATGQTMVDSVVEKKLRDSQTVKAIHVEISGLKTKYDTLQVRLDTVERKVETVDKKFDALFSILADADPKFREAAQRRVKQNRDAEDIKAAITGGTQ